MTCARAKTVFSHKRFKTQKRIFPLSPSPEKKPDWKLQHLHGVEFYELRPTSCLRLIFTTRKGGVSTGLYASWNLSFEVGDLPAAVAENRVRLLKALRDTWTSSVQAHSPRRNLELVTLQQTHSDIILPVSDTVPQPDAEKGDALFTNIPSLALGIKVADCLPVYIFSLRQRAIGLAHCGWRGTAARLAEKLARQMACQLSLPLTELCFALGPCICTNCYTVGEDVAAAFRRAYPLAEKFLLPPEQIALTRIGSLPSHLGELYHLDLRAANRWQLVELGLTETASLNLCSKENPALFYSARRNQPTGRNLALILLQE